MLRLGVADEMRILLAVVVLPLGEQLVAVAVAKLVQKLVGAVLNGAVAEGIHPNADGQAGERIMVFGARQHRSLIAQPPDVAEKSKHHERRDANSNTDLYASKPHPERKFIWSATSRKITAGSRNGTCTCGEGGRSPGAVSPFLCFSWLSPQSEGQDLDDFPDKENGHGFRHAL
jgi:hypothetical protein